MNDLTAGLPRPVIRPVEALALAEDLYGITGTVRELGSQQDRNFLITIPEGERYLFKISNPVFTTEELEAQNTVMALVNETVLPSPTAQPSLDGSLIETVDLKGVAHRVRLLSFVEGTPLIDSAHLGETVVAQLGRVAGEFSVAVREVQHPGLDRQLQWDLRSGERVLRDLLHYVTDAERHARLEATLAQIQASAPLFAELPVQPVHGDLTDDNVVCRVDESGRPVITGFIDFGDVSLGWRVAELAVACSAVFHHDPANPLAVLPLIRAFDAVSPLSDAEIDALWPLITLRGATLVVSGEQQVAIDPTNEYADSAREREWQVYASPASVPVWLATAAIRRALGRPIADAAPAAIITALTSAPTLVDLGYASRALRDGEWLDDPAAAEARVLHASGGLAATRFGEARLTRARALDRRAPENVALGVQVVGVGEIVAPFGGEVTVAAEGTLLLRGTERTLVLDGIHSTSARSVSAGDALGAASEMLTVWLLAADVDEAPPLFVTRALFEGWRHVALDPAPVLGLAETSAPLPDAAVELARRDAAYDRLQSHYYARPPQIERGWRELLIDTEGRHYLDMVNNVTVLGHGHPRIAEAAADQWRILNTNSRFHYDAVTELSERLLATLPDSFDTVLLVNSGSEAVDLALRLTIAFSGREHVMCLTESYHGWTTATDAVSTSESDNPIAASLRAPWVHATTTPNAYRGPHRGRDAGAAYAADTIADLEALAAAGTLIGTFLAEPRQGNAGAIEVPPGYFAAVYDAVRAGGGVVISDEVQVGYGRQGDVFWGYQQHEGVVPDVISVAKAMGNGHPLGAVITRRDIAEALAAQGTFFSSAGGSTLSARLGVEILDVIRDERLQQNAHEVGAHLRRRLEQLGERHPLVGAVHGRGLYMGLELVRDRTTLEPATEETAAICDRMRQLGVVVQPTGDRQNILKVKPPLCFSVTSADYFVDALDEVLTRGW